MLDKELCERLSDFLVAEGVEVAPIKRERSCVGPGPTAGAQIDDDMGGVISVTVVATGFPEYK